jgi:mono/diheme cytochrome c family protein
MHARQLLGPALLIVYLAVTTTGLPAQDGNPDAQQLKNPEAATAESIAAGEELYQLNCQFCHGPKGLGDGPLAPPDTPNLVDGEWKHGSTDGEIFTVIQKGIPPAFMMPPTEGRLSDTEIWHIVNYVRSIGPPDAPR